jgi:hypothetical protein
LICWSRYRLETLHREVEEAEALESLLDAPVTRGAKAEVARGGAGIDRRTQ